MASGAISATFITERYTYWHRSSENEGCQPLTDSDPLHLNPIHLSIEHAATTIGGHIISEEHDETGIMIWPATHLICQHLVSSTLIRKGDVVVELGCGCGMLGIAAAKSHSPPSVWIATDMSGSALELCRRNFDLNGVGTIPDFVGSVRQLIWGNSEEIMEILGELPGARRNPGQQVDIVIGADIVYPATCGQTLHQLLSTVKLLLKPNGTFLLSFASRDGPRTPIKLIDAATRAGFEITCLSPLRPHVVKLLPPLLDSKILVLRNSQTPQEHNSLLGTKDCTVFPGLIEAHERLLAEEGRVEVWDAPFSDADQN